MYEYEDKWHDMEIIILPGYEPVQSAYAWAAEALDGRDCARIGGQFWLSDNDTHIWLMHHTNKGSVILFSLSKYGSIRPAQSPHGSHWQGELAYLMNMWLAFWKTGCQVVKSVNGNMVLSDGTGQEAEFANGGATIYPITEGTHHAH